MTNEAARIEAALDLIIRCGGFDGDHHKTWVIDQVTRILAGPRYKTLVKEACEDEDGNQICEWDEGIAP